MGVRVNQGKRKLLVSLWLGICLCACSASAIDYVFPAAANIIDVSQSPYSADRTGKTDVSATLSRAVNDAINNFNSWSPRFVYLPNGTYLVKNTIAWSLNSHGNGIGPHIIGQSRKGAVIKLAKGTWPLGTEEKAVMQTGAGDENNFGKGVRNLTVLVDSNNAGAIGIVYVSDNNGIISDVDIISADGKGMYGIQSAGNYTGSAVGGNGPFIVRRTFIKGFGVGMRACGTQSETVSQIRLEGQSKYGLWATCSNLTIDSLTSNDTVQAVEAQAPVLVTHALLLNGAPTRYGLRNFVFSSYFSDVVTSGYKAAITSAGPNSAPKTTSFDEYTPVRPISLFPSPKRSMRLPTKYPPEVAWESDFTKWAFPTSQQALQTAIDDASKTTICIARGTVIQISGSVTVRGNISRIFGTGGTITVPQGGSGQFVFEDGTAPVVVISNLAMTNVGDDSYPDLQVVKRSTRTLVIESINQFDYQIVGGGETYITDITSNRNLIDNAGARVWMWQWEGSPFADSTLVVRNGIVRSVGCYHEGSGSKFFLLGGYTELLGSWEYATTCGSHAGKYLVSIRNNANVSIGGYWQQSFCPAGESYLQLVSEIRNGVSKTLGTAAGNGDTVNPGGGSIALFSAFDSTQMQTGIATPAPQQNKSAYLSAFQRPAGIEIIYRTASPGPVTLVAYDLAGRIIATIKERPLAAGVHRALLPHIAGAVCVQVRSGEGRAQRFSIFPSQ
jgi:hypothetical protein